MLEQRHEKAVELCRKLGPDWKACARLRKRRSELAVRCGARWARSVRWEDAVFTADDMAIFGLVLKLYVGGWLRDLDLCCMDDSGLQSLCDSLGDAALPSLRRLDLSRDNSFGPASAAALAATLRRRGLPRLEELNLAYNDLRNEGVSVLGSALRRHKRLRKLNLYHTGMDDEGVALLFADLRSDDFRALESLKLDTRDRGKIGEASIDTLVAAIDGGALQQLWRVEFGYERPGSMSWVYDTGPGFMTGAEFFAQPVHHAIGRARVKRLAAPQPALGPFVMPQRWRLTCHHPGQQIRSFFPVHTLYYSRAGKV